MNKDRLWRWQARYAPYLFVLPFVVIFSVFLLYPLGRSLAMSFYKTAGPRRAIFVGMDNYRFLLKDWMFWGAVANTTAYTLAFLVIQTPLSLGLAMLLNHPRVRFRNFFRFSFFSTNLTGQVFVAVVFALLFEKDHGMVNRGLGLLGIEPIAWLTNPNWMMVAVLIAGLWLSVGFGMIYFLAALQSVDKDLYEAADIDGAGWAAKFFNVTLPGIRPVLTFLVFTGTIAGFQLFELPYVLFRGPGPSARGLTIVMYLFLTGFNIGDLGYAAAIGWMLVLIVLCIGLLQIRLAKRMEN